MAVIAPWPELVEEPRLAAPPRRITARSVTKAFIACDVVAIAVAMTLAYFVRRYFARGTSSGENDHLWLGAFSVPVWIGLFGRVRLYSDRHVRNRLDEFRRIVHGVSAGVVSIAVLGFALKVYPARGWLVLCFVFGVATVTLAREAVRRDCLDLRRSGGLAQPVVVVGANLEALALGAMLVSDPTLGYNVVGFVDDGANEGTYLLGDRPVLGRVDETLDVVRATGATGVIVATTAVDLVSSNRLIRELTDAGIHVELSSSLRDISPGRLMVQALGEFPVVYVDPVSRTGWRPVAKRVFDMCGAGLVLLLASPLLLLVPLAVKRDSEGPVLFRQTRVGKDGRPFRILKFRTMVADAERNVIDLRDHNEADGPLFKIKDDPRVTGVGRLLRALSIDELPQLWNVLRGEMSLVGPRPALPSELAVWPPALHSRLRVQPGITGMWQVSGRSEASFDQYARLDLYYVDNWSLWTDLAIVAKTIPTVLFRRGAY